MWPLLLFVTPETPCKIRTKMIIIIKNGFFILVIVMVINIRWMLRRMHLAFMHHKYKNIQSLSRCNGVVLAYRQFSNIRRTQFQNINGSRLVLQLPLPNPLKPGIKLRMKMKLEQRRQAMLQLHLSDQQFYCLLRCVLY